MKKYVYILSMVISLIGHAKGDPEAGKIKSQTCIACHGREGIGMQPVWPNLAGQHSVYILKQLEDFKKGSSRSDPLMTTIVAALNRQDMEDLAVFYASLPVPEKQKKKQNLERGEQLYKAGDAKKHIIACIACHGPKATGNNQSGFPALAGQKAQYTILQMQAFKTGKRTNDVQETMRDISKRMEQEEIEALAYYLEGL